MWPGLKEYLDNASPQEISLVQFMKGFPEIHDKDDVRAIWTGALGYLHQHPSRDKRALSVSLLKSKREIVRKIDLELQEVCQEKALKCHSSYTSICV
jgi:hypothetical protein